MRAPQAKGYVARPYGTLKEAARRLVDSCGGLERAAERCRVSASTLHRATDPAHPEAHLSIDVVLALEATAGEPVVTAQLAAEARAVLVPLPRHDAAPLDRDLAEVGRELAELFGAYARGKADGVLTEAEIRDCLREVDEGLRALGLLRADLSDALANALPDAPAAGPQAGSQTTRPLRAVS